jgi:Mrp family chromosome partitioning ATPase
VGSSEASAWLAWGLAEIGNRVVLLDVDTARAGEASAMLELPQRNAPSRRKRSDGTAFEQQLIERETPAGGRLSALPATAAADASATLTPAGVGGFLQRVRDDADVVLLNVPAITDSSWALVLTEHADAMVVVARLPRTRRADVARLRDAVAWTPTPALGAVVVGGEGHADPASAPPMTSSNGAKKDPLTLESWARDIVSQGG